MIFSYFIVNELLKSYPENNLWPHWRIVPLVSNLVNSFRGTAQIVAGNRLVNVFIIQLHT